MHTVVATLPLMGHLSVKPDGSSVARVVLKTRPSLSLWGVTSGDTLSSVKNCARASQNNSPPRITTAVPNGQNGLAMMLGSVAVASASPAGAADGSEELDEETKQKITQVRPTRRQRYRFCFLQAGLLTLLFSLVRKI